MARFVRMLLIIGYVSTVSGKNIVELKNSIANQDTNNEAVDLKSAASTHYSGWMDPYANSAYEVTGHGTLDDKGYNTFDGVRNYHGYNIYDSNYERIPDHGYTGALDGYEGNYASYSGYKNIKGYKPPTDNVGYYPYSGNSGYGGYGGNGGLSSYLGYNNPYYHGSNHLGYGYYKKPGYSGIHNSGITPSLVTGYRGYSKK